MSFAHRFRSEFPIHQGNDGVVRREVPIAMVALVATAVSVTYINSFLSDYGQYDISFMPPYKNGVLEPRSRWNFPPTPI